MQTICEILNPQVTPSVAATGVLTSADTGQFTAGKIVTVGTKVYTFRATISTGPTIPFEVKLGADADASLANLVKAINLSGVAGTDYSVGTTIHPDVSAGTVAAHATTLTAKELGFAGNAIVSTTDEAKLSFAAATLVDGVGGVLSSAALGGATLTAYTDKMDVGSYTELINFLHVTAHSGTNPTLDVTQQLSPDGVNWIDGDAFTQVTTGDTMTIKRTTANFGKWMRFKVVLGGTTPRYVLSLSTAGKN